MTLMGIHVIPGAVSKIELLNEIGRYSLVFMRSTLDTPQVRLRVGMIRHRHRNRNRLFRY